MQGRRAFNHEWTRMDTNRNRKDPFRVVGRLKIAVAKHSVARHVFSMSTIEEIKMAISKLSLEERAELTAELCGWTDDDRDRQMKADAAVGKFTPLNREADAACAAGQTAPLEDILHEP